MIMDSFSSHPIATVQLAALHIAPGFIKTEPSKSREEDVNHIKHGKVQAGKK